MKQIITNYTFDKTAKTVTFTDFATISLNRVLLITNVTANVIIYQFNDVALGGTAATNVLTLTYNTAAMANTDKLQIIYDIDVLDSGNLLKVREQYGPAAEDNTNQVIAQQIRPVAGTTYAATAFANFGTDVDLSVKATPGNLLSIVATNKNAAVRYLQVHNKASAPAGADVPVLSLPIGAGTANNPGILTLGRDVLGQGGKYLSTGIAMGISTAEATFTAATTTDHDYYGQYI